jgi:hypothetical protein
VQFASFAKGHPDFSNSPYRGRTPIFFDHASHLGQHFTEMKEKAPRSCQDCHEPQIEGAGMTVKGAAFFTVPGIDADTLAAASISIGEWPKFADAKITPFMELFLRPAMAASSINCAVWISST